MNDGRTSASNCAEAVPPVRYRLREDDGRAYASFRLKPGISLAAFLAALPELDDVQVELA